MQKTKCLDWALKFQRLEEEYSKKKEEFQKLEEEHSKKKEEIKELTEAYDRLMEERDMAQEEVCIIQDTIPTECDKFLCSFLSSKSLLTAAFLSSRK